MGYDCVMVPGASTFTIGGMKPAEICGRLFATKTTMGVIAKTTICCKLKLG
jgi:hypothetical protein